MPSNDTKCQRTGHGRSAIFIGWRYIYVRLQPFARRGNRVTSVTPVKRHNGERCKLQAQPAPFSRRRSILVSAIDVFIMFSVRWNWLGRWRLRRLLRDEKAAKLFPAAAIIRGLIEHVIHRIIEMHIRVIRCNGDINSQLIVNPKVSETFRHTRGYKSVGRKYKSSNDKCKLKAGDIKLSNTLFRTRAWYMARPYITSQ